MNTDPTVSTALGSDLVQILIFPFSEYAYNIGISRLADVDDDLREASQKWAEQPISDMHVSCIKSLIATLWPDEYEQADWWLDPLHPWVESERECEQQQNTKVYVFSKK